MSEIIRKMLARYQLKHFKEWTDACTVRRANLYTEMRILYNDGGTTKGHQRRKGGKPGT